MASSVWGHNLLSYVDDGCITCTTLSIDDNCTNLRCAYKVMTEVATSAGLVMEHSKTELFHFARTNKMPNLDLVVDSAPYNTAESPLRPKEVWRYLGIFFDRRLNFKEHVRFYTTKAYTTINAMRMLGTVTQTIDSMFGTFGLLVDFPYKERG